MNLMPSDRNMNLMPTDKRKKATLLRIVDGDTVEVALGGGLFRSPKTARIRLYGIDAPESSQKGSKSPPRI